MPVTLLTIIIDIESKSRIILTRQVKAASQVHKITEMEAVQLETLPKALDVQHDCVVRNLTILSEIMNRSNPKGLIHKQRFKRHRAAEHEFNEHMTKRS